MNGGNTQVITSNRKSNDDLWRKKEKKYVFFLNVTCTSNHSFFFADDVNARLRSGKPHRVKATMSTVQGKSSRQLKDTFMHLPPPPPPPSHDASPIWARSKKCLFFPHQYILLIFLFLVFLFVFGCGFLYGSKREQQRIIIIFRTTDRKSHTSAESYFVKTRVIFSKFRGFISGEKKIDLLKYLLNI